MTADVAFHVELARSANGPIVELAVGNGRVAIPVATATDDCREYVFVARRRYGSTTKSSRCTTSWGKPSGRSTVRRPWYRCSCCDV
jgi:hypothetical protein